MRSQHPQGSRSKPGRLVLGRETPRTCLTSTTLRNAAIDTVEEWPANLLVPNRADARRPGTERYSPRVSGTSPMPLVVGFSNGAPAFGPFVTSSGSLSATKTQPARPSPAPSTRHDYRTSRSAVVVVLSGATAPLVVTPMRDGLSEWEGFGPLVSRAGPCEPKASTVGSRGLATLAVGSTPMKTAHGPALARRTVCVGVRSHDPGAACL